MNLRIVSIRKGLEELVPVILVLGYVMAESSGDGFAVAFRLSISLPVVGSDWDLFRTEDCADDGKELGDGLQAAGYGLWDSICKHRSFRVVHRNRACEVGIAVLDHEYDAFPAFSSG